jgi:phage shock protein PspC (stress-responsive transcriptional regulator)
MENRDLRFLARIVLRRGHPLGLDAANAKEQMMQQVQPSVFARDHTFLGVCEAIGEDFGFNPIWLRLVLPVLLFINPAATIGVYLGAGALVLATRLLVPNPRAAAPQPAAEAAPPPAEEEAGPEQIPLAA